MFRPEVSHFGATGSSGDGDVEGFVKLVNQSIGGVAVMQTEPFEPPSALRSTSRAEGLQMVLQTLPKRRLAPSICALSTVDVPEMLRLVALTEPGPFRVRTGTLGSYLGVRHQGRLIAMAGERLKVPGFTEISAVCVHPDHRGSGLARALVTALINLILSRSETPMLHLYRDNHPARSLYESLGFQLRAPVYIEVMESTRAKAKLDEKNTSQPSLDIMAGRHD